MVRNISILLVLALIVALPFLFRRETGVREWKPGDPVLVIITPMNEAIRHEFAMGFSRWHAQRHGAPVKVDWRNIGGTTEISRYLTSEFVSSFRAWWTAQGRPWRGDGASIILNKSFDPAKKPDGVEEADWAEQVAMYRAFRETDDPRAFSSQIDMYFGGGAYDGDNATRQGLLVPAWVPGKIPPGLIATGEGVELIPEGMSGEAWRTPTWYGTTLSTFGICYNRDRMKAQGIEQEPASWKDLADPRWFGTLGLADPTKSGSIAKAFETIVQVQCRKAVEAAGFGDKAGAFEAAIAAARLPPGELPDEVPAAYQDAVEQGWVNGLRLLQAIGANARYFTDSASKVPLDVGMGNAAAGLAIDFYGRFEAQVSNHGRGWDAMAYVTPRGESGVSADPISILRGAPRREIAVRFIEYLLSEDGQRLWCYRPGEPGGPEKYALQRFPIRRDFYPSANPAFQASYERHRPHTTDDLGAPTLDAYRLAEEYVYHPRWTAGHFGLLRDLVRAMCLDAGQELRKAWGAIVAAGGPAACPRALEALQRLPQVPEPLTWTSGLAMGKKYDRLDLLREWTLQYRAQYAEAARLAREEARP
ncbi:MAG: extracellular solute-binding protein [Kiritimatiellae bacterium]|jgi:ABC-type Fe3+ transport system substrate-binding protein|nr:extracellular solute-binding protein [Kiritimatiellia bacterium]NLD89604.1 extracellular solute-binding protein [Lentisphaerota bacterium]HQN79589.1 extracellular solute-binding protein [Kiritimatiellia bacterium]